jgi:hypothetical protein
MRAGTVRQLEKGFLRTLPPEIIAGAERRLFAVSVPNDHKKARF